MNLAATGKTTLWYALSIRACPLADFCRSIQDLQSSKMRDIGIAYFYLRRGTSFAVVQMLQFWIVQLAVQCGSLPSDLLSKESSIQQWYSLPPLAETSYSAWKDCLQSLLASLLIKFPRTFLLFDGLDQIKFTQKRAGVIETLQVLLEQDFGNISIAIFCRPDSYLEPLLQLADVFIELTPMEPRP